jgi:lysozyme
MLRRSRVTEKVARTPPKAPAIIAAAVLLGTTALTIPSEGVVLHPYYDPAKILSWCAGETKGKPKPTYTMQECVALLNDRMARDYAPEVERCAPEAVREDRVNLFAALLDAHYNTGAVCSSPMVAKLKAGDVRGSCLTFTAKGSVGVLVTHGWFTTARYRGPAKPANTMRAHGWTWTAGAWRKELSGLVTRRQKEARLCLADAA